jgi:nucleoside-diphosphate-sugar epimerase
VTDARALVTGGSGFIGRHLIGRLMRDGVPVTAVVRRECHSVQQWASQLDLVSVSDWSEAGLREALCGRRFDVMFHLAVYGTNPADRDLDQMLRVNVALPTTMVRLAKTYGARLVMAGTFSEYRAPEARIPLTERASLESEKLYGASKAAGSLMASAMAANLSVDLCLLRFFHVYGPGEAAHRLLPSLLSGLSRGRRVPLSTGTQVRDFVYVADVIEALVAATALRTEHDRPSTEVLNVCTGVGHAVRDFAELVADAMGARRELLGFGDLALRPDDSEWLVGNGDRIARRIGWRPRYDLAAGVRAAIRDTAAHTQAR